MIDKFSDEWVLLGHEQCPWCIKTKRLLEEEAIDYKYYNIRDYEQIALRDWMVENGLKTVPQVFHNGIRIGGYEQTEQYVKGKKLP